MKNTNGLLKGGLIGHKGGEGRPPDWLKEKCRTIVEKDKLIDFLGDVAGGKNVDTKVLYDSKGNQTIVSCCAALKDRLKATEILIDRGFGKATQPVGDKDDGLADLGKMLRERYGIPCVLDLK